MNDLASFDDELERREIFFEATINISEDELEEAEGSLAQAVQNVVGASGAIVLGIGDDD